MEIMIRTYDQFRDDRVKVEVSPGQRAEITIDGELSTVTETDRTAETRDRSNGELRRRIADLEAALGAKEAIIDQHVKGLIESRDFRAKERQRAREHVEALTHQLDRVTAAVRGETMDQATVEYVNHDDFKIRHMARRLRRIRAVIGHCEPEAEQDTEA